MTITTKPTSLKAELDKCNPNTMPTLLQKIRFGSLVRAMKTQLMGVDPAADAYQLATVESIGLAEDAKAATVLRAYGRVGGVTAGELAVQAYGATPSTGQIAVAPNGDIVVLAADAWTSVEVYYEPMQYDVVEFELAAPAGDLTLPTSVAGKVLALLEAEATTVDSGGISGKKIILVNASSAPATTKAALNLAKTHVLFNTATDKVTKARVKLAVTLDVDVNALLTGESHTY